MAFKILSVNKHIGILHPRQTILCTSQFNGEDNIITLAWTMIISRTPPIIAISIAPQRFSHDMVKNSKEFTINVPTKDIISEVYYCGTHSGRNINKFAQTKLTPLQGVNVKCPRIKECFAQLECKVIDEKSYGDHTLFVGEVVTCIAKEGLLTDDRIKYIQIPYHLGSNRFIYNKNEIEKV